MIEEWLLAKDNYVPKEEKSLFLRSLIFPIITLIALIPAMIYGNIQNSLLLFQKLIITILIMNLLSHNTKWSEISKSLKVLRIPDIFIWIMDINIFLLSLTFKV